MPPNYQGNDYNAFLSNANDAQTLNELIDFLQGAGYEGTCFDGIEPEGEVNDQYEIIISGDSKLVLDRHSDDRIFISRDGEKTFLEMVDEEIERRCLGFDYDTYLSFQHAMERDD